MTTHKNRFATYELDAYSLNDLICDVWRDAFVVLDQELLTDVAANEATRYQDRAELAWRHYHDWPLPPEFVGV